jgi:glycosyltransferase involved in cell wall biosynthesis
MKILLVAYACEPERGSEPGVGWNTAWHLAEEHDVFVITRKNNQTAIERHLSLTPRPQLHFAYHDLKWALRFKRGSAMVYPYHYLWQLTVGQVAASLHARHRFNAAHQITLGSFRYPTTLKSLGIPVILGPLGGAEEPPLRLWAGLGARGIAFEALRWFANRTATFDPLVRRSLSESALVLAASPDGGQFISRHYPVSNVKIIPAIAVTHQPPDPVGTEKAASKTLRALFVGRLVPWKGCHLALQAIRGALDLGSAVTLTVLGRGPDRSRLDRLVDRLALASHVSFVDRVPRLEDVGRMYSQHDVLLLPSLHDSGGMAVIEAMASSMPVVCLGIGGPSFSVTSEVGFTAAPTNPQEAVKAMAIALSTLAQDSGLRSRMNNQARQRAMTTFSWPARAKQFTAIYQDCIANRH